MICSIIADACDVWLSDIDCHVLSKLCSDVESLVSRLRAASTLPHPRAGMDVLDDINYPYRNTSTASLDALLMLTALR